MAGLKLRKPQYDSRSFIPNSCHLGAYPDNPCPKPMQVAPEDFGCEMDEKELVEKLITPLPISFPLPDYPDFEPDDFEKIFRWFLA